MNKFNKIVIGTAQLGLDYGISNKYGKTTKKEAYKIFKTAIYKKINFIDTSSAYGKAENIIGNLTNKKFNVITKYNLKKICKKRTNIKNELISLIEDSRKKLKVKKIYAVLLQNSEMILNIKTGKTIYETLKYAKKKNLISKFGYSIYSYSKLPILCKKFRPDIIQCQYNIFDRRLVKKNYLKIFKTKKIEVHVRSIFLQGLLLMKFKNIPPYFMKWKKLFQEWENWLKKNNISPLEACFRFVANTRNINKIVIGFDNSEQVNQLFKINLKKKYIFPSKIITFDKKLIDPQLWPKKR